jgi:hypothetical protein
MMMMMFTAIGEVERMISTAPTAFLAFQLELEACTSPPALLTLSRLVAEWLHIIA